MNKGRILRGALPLAAGLLLSCGAAKEQRAARLSLRTDSIATLRAEGFLRRQELRRLDLRTVHLRQVRLSPPDSAGRQYLLTVTTATLRENTARSATDTARLTTVGSATRSGGNLDASGSDTRRTAIPWWLWLLGGATLVRLLLRGK